jgi:WhiB family redox-sensing transcriptional regulator
MSLPALSWQAAAACRGLPAAAVFARRAADAEPALRACAVCTVRRECEETVAPAASWFDGVCAGRLWRNGRAAQAGSVRTEAAGAAGAVRARRASGTGGTAGAAVGVGATTGERGAGERGTGV